MKVKHVTIIGAGAIGLGWSIVFVQSGIQVSVFDVDDNQRKLFKDKVRERLELLKEYELLSAEIDDLLKLIIVHERIDEACVEIGRAHV